MARRPLRLDAPRSRRRRRTTSATAFGPTYSYSAFTTLPAPLCHRYHLDPNGRYVYSNGYIYVVDPATYAVTRVIDMFSR